MESVLHPRSTHEHLNGTTTASSAKAQPTAPTSKAHVLVPVRLDSSAEDLQTALAVAASLRPGAKLTLLHVLAPTDSHGHSFHWLDGIEKLHASRTRLSSIEDTRTALLTRIERDVSDPVRSALKFQTECRIGEPAAEIARFAEEQAVDLVILCHGRGGWRLPFMPRLSDRVLRLIDAPVILVHPAAETRKAPTS